MFCHAHSNDGFTNYDGISQIIGYKDESLEICFKDGSNLQLSPCGANFKYVKAQEKPVSLLAKRLNEVSQRCVFATSETRSKVIQGLMIRNQICQRPYLVSDFAEAMGLQPFRLYKELEEFEWPSPMHHFHSNSSSCRSINCTSDGIVTVTSKDNFAELELLPGGYKIQVSYAARFIEDSLTNKENGCKQQRGGKGVHFTHVWQKQIFPASKCPKEWRYPLELAFGSQSETKLTEAPQSLPRKCPKQFDHKWRSSEGCALGSDPDTSNGASSNICFLWCNGDSYWVSHSSSSGPSIEVWMSNGNILQSHPTNDRYFVYKFRDEKNDSCGEDGFVERIMSSAFIPQDLKLKSVFLCAIRLLTYASQQCIAQESIPCWDRAHDTSVLPKDIQFSDSARIDLHENVHIPRVGTFSAVEDSIQIAFDDGAMLHMFIKLDNSCHARSIETSQCRIVLTDGQYFVTDDLTHSDPRAAKYVTHASCWVEWLSKSSDERLHEPFYSNTIYDTKKVDMVSHELDKIHKVTYRQVCGDNLCDDFKYLELSGGRRVLCENFQDVSSALSRTTKAIEDLDVVISSFRKNSSK